MAYRVELKTPAVRVLASLPRSDQQRIRTRIDMLAENARPPGCKKLAGENDLYRIRAGAYRVVYSIEDARLRVLVVRIGHRREVYRQ